MLKACTAPTFEERSAAAKAAIRIRWDRYRALQVPWGELKAGETISEYIDRVWTFELVRRWEEHLDRMIKADSFREATRVLTAMTAMCQRLTPARGRKAANVAPQESSLPSSVDLSHIT